MTSAAAPSPSPDPKLKDVLLVGFGAIGIIYAYVLERSGRARVTAVARSNYEAVKRDGVHIMSDRYGEVRGWRPCRVCSSITEALDRPYSYAAVATKVVPEIISTTNAALLAPLLAPSYSDTYPQPVYVLLQNGLGIERDLYEAAVKLEQGEEKRPRIIGCTLTIGANLVNGGNGVEHNNLDKVVMGLYKHENYTDESQTREEIELLDDFAGMLREGGSQVTIVPEIQRYRFRKNFWNTAFSTISTTTRLPLGAIFQEPAAQVVEPVAIPVIRAIMHEHLAVCRAMGFGEAAVPSSIVEETIESVRGMHRRTDASLRQTKPSMLVDCEDGRPMEVEVIVGEVVRMARERGVDIPRIETLYALLVIIQAQIMKNLRQ